MRLTFEKMENSQIPRYKVSRGGDKLLLGVIEWDERRKTHVLWSDMYHPYDISALRDIATYCEFLDSEVSAPKEVVEREKCLNPSPSESKN